MKRWRRVLSRTGRVMAWGSAAMVVVLVASLVLIYQLTKVPRPESLALPQLVTIQYADGTTLARIVQPGSSDGDRTIVSLSSVPDAVRWDVLAAEDRGFYSEPGVSIKGTLRAAVSDLTGGDTQGGSGITQQYVKNAFLSDSRTLSRKLKELMIAIKLSRKYSKDKILEFYLNTVYFGRGAYGIQAAARAYFGVSVSKLNTAQGAVLAGLLKSPADYDPATDPQAATARWHYVINGMVATHHLTAAAAAALTYPPFRKPDTNGLGVSGWKYLIVQRVLAELQADGISNDEVFYKGLTIRTTIDPTAQTDAVNAVAQTFSNLTDAQKSMKNALVAVNPSTGGILAYWGGAGPGVPGYDGQVNYNDWAHLDRPPGSSFKPFTLATALTQTVKHTSTQLYGINSYVDGSLCTTVQGTQICNDPSDAGASGPSVTIAYALKWSLNTTFDEMAQAVGPPNVAKTAHAMGISRVGANGQPTLINASGQTTFGIGIGDFPVSPTDQATAFATLANNGLANGSYFVQRATASNGDVVYQHKARTSRAIDPRVANDVTLAMEPIAGFSEVPLSGGRVSAAKTGTEGIYSNPGSATTTGNSDAWMVGFTPQVSTAVWVGSGSSAPIVNSAGRPEYGRDLPGRTWQAFMDAYLTGKPYAPMPTTQLIPAGGDATAPIGGTTPTTSFDTAPPTTPTPTPTTSPSTPTTSTTAGTPTTGSSTSVPPTSTRPTAPTVTCTQGGLLGPPTCTTVPAPGG